MPGKEEQLRVLVMRLSAMGDILHALPAVTALREAHPEWWIGWAVEPHWKPLLATDSAVVRGSAMPIVDRVHVVPARRWARSPLSARTLREVRTTHRELRDEKYDVCVDIQGAFRSGMIARWARAERVIGEDNPREGIARMFFTERVKTHGVHVIEQAIEVMNAIAADSLPVRLPLLPIDPEAERKAKFFPEPIVLLNPGAGWGAKRWPVNRYAVVAQRLFDAGYTVIVNSGPGEDRLASEINILSNGAAEPREASSIAELIAVTRRAALVIGGDTGPVHLASALDIPVVGIFGPTDPARNGPFGGRFRVLRHPESKRDHTRHSAPEAGLLTITPDDVMDAATKLLRGKQ